MEEKEIAKKNVQKLKPQMGVIPRNTAEIMQMATILAKSNVVPKEMIGKPESVFLAIALGLEIGLPPMQAVSSIMVVNGRPTIWGDALKAIILSREVGGFTVCESFDEDPPNVALEQGYGRCKVKRRGKPAKEYRFSIEDAKRAGLWGKPGTWQNYPGRMLQMRARGWVCRDEFPDLLKGLQPREEVLDTTAQYESTVMPEELQEVDPAMKDAATHIVAPIMGETYRIKTNDPGSHTMSLESPTGDHDHGTMEVDIKPQQEPSLAPSKASHGEVGFVSGSDRKELFKLTKSKKITLDDLKKYLFESFGLTSTAEITYSQLHEIHDWIDKK